MRTYMPSLLASLAVFWQFLKRDTYVHIKNIKDYALNYVVFFPSIFGLAFAFLMGQVYFGKGEYTQATLLFSGNVIIIMMLVTYKEAITLLFDLNGSKIINYQITLMHPRLVIFERIIFNGIFTFLMSAPFFPVAKLLLGKYFDTSTTNWPLVFVVLFFSSFVLAGYHQCASLILKTPERISSLWSRVNNFLIFFGGFLVPWYVMNTYEPLFGKLILLNPVIYVTEGTRQALIGGPQFFDVRLCLLMLAIYFIGFTFTSFYVFKKRVDHI